MMTDKTQELKIKPKRAKKPTPWYLLTGLFLGFILGVAYARLVNPVVYENTEPSSLHEDYQESYQLQIDDENGFNNPITFIQALELFIFSLLTSILAIEL